MKSSIKFREEKGPLLRAKIPFSVGPIPLSSGIALGTKQDLSVHVGTCFSAGPSVKLAFRPNEQNPLSVILKAGLGLWGSPNGGSSLTLTAELHLMPKGKEPMFSLRIGPRIGDFSIKKDALISDFVSLTPKQGSLGVSALPWSESAEPTRSASTPLKGENGSFSSLALPNVESKAGIKRDPDRAQYSSSSPSVDSNGVSNIGSNVSMKIEGFDRDRKSHGDRKKKPDDFKEHDAESDVSATEILQVPESEKIKMDYHKVSSPFSFNGAQIGLQNYKIMAHSSLPLGSHGRINVRWGVKPPPEVFQGWDNVLPSLSLSNLPSILLDKVSFESTVPTVSQKESKPDPPPYLGYSGYVDHINLLEDNQELAQVAAMCYSMKKQLHLIHAENQVLRRAMEEMGAEVEIRNNWNVNGIGENKNQVIPRSNTPQLHPNIKQDVPRELETRKNRKEQLKKEPEAVSIKSASSVGPNAEMSEFEKAIMNAKTSPIAGKKE